MFDVSLKDVCCVFFFSFFSLHFVESVAQHKHTRLMKLESYRIWFIYCYFAVGARVLTYETVLGLFYIYTNCVHVTWQKARFFPNYFFFSFKLVQLLKIEMRRSSLAALFLQFDKWAATWKNKSAGCYWQSVSIQ